MRAAKVRVIISTRRSTGDTQKMGESAGTGEALA